MFYFVGQFFILPRLLWLAAQHHYSAVSALVIQSKVYSVQINCEGFRGPPVSFVYRCDHLSIIGVRTLIIDLMVRITPNYLQFCS